MKTLLPILSFFLLLACQEQSSENLKSAEKEVQFGTIDIRNGVWITVLGNVQDGGSPHICCEKNCCKDLFQSPDKERKVSSLGVIDYKFNRSYIFDATPDFTSQLEYLNNKMSVGAKLLDGIFLTHAHIGHYTGLMYLGREAKGADSIPVYAMPRMEKFLRNNGPWSQLVELGNIEIQPLDTARGIILSDQLKVVPFTVPHRDEFSETVGYKIIGPNKTALFIPDINKWSLWEKSIVEEVAKVDFAFLDATFYDESEVNRDMSEIPHPFVIETVKLFENLDIREKRKITFIHFNHTNPLLDLNSPESDSVLEKGFNIATFGEEFAL
jgi:pyrroloquinoline quinone biosynthesis protein B